MISSLCTAAYECLQLNMSRVKDGITDYYVTNKLDVQALRQFQSRHRSPAKLFKRVPDRFEIYFGRKELLAGENE
jgi:hypothetical protein